MKNILPLFLILTVLFGDNICKAKNQNKIDSLETVLKIAKEDTNKVNILNELANEISRTDPDTSILLLTQTLQLAKKIGWQIGLGQSHHILGNCYTRKAEYVQALDHYSEALSMYEELEKSDKNSKVQILKLRSKTLANIVSIYVNQGDYLKALDCAFKALKISEELSDEEQQALVLHNIGNLYTAQNNCSQALDYFFKALKKKEKLGNEESQSSTLNSIGSVYTLKKDYQKALDYYFKALRITEKLGLIQNQSSIIGNIGVVYEYQSDYTKALDNYFKALQMAKEIDDKTEIVSDLTNIGSVYFKQNKLDEANKFHHEALKLGIEIGEMDVIRDENENLSEVYNKKGDFKKAFEHYKQSIIARDSISNEETAKKQTRLEMNYEFEKKEAATRAEQDKKDALTIAETKRQTLIRNSTFGGVGIAGIFSFLLVRSFTRRRKTSFEKQVSEVEMKALRSQMNPHFIFNSLQSVKEYILQNAKNDAAEYLSKFSRLMRLILENSRQQEVPLIEDLAALELYMQLESLRFQNRFQYQIEVDEQIDKENTLIPPLLLQPFVENSIIHGVRAKENGVIKIKVVIENNMIRCTVEDNGIGRQQSVIIETGEEKKRESLGMKITQERLNIINQLKKVQTAINIFDLKDAENKLCGLRVELLLPFETVF